MIAMNSAYAAVAELVQTWGLLFFVLAFLAAVAYALWPSNRKKFDDAARTPLRKDD